MIQAPGLANGSKALNSNNYNHADSRSWMCESTISSSRTAIEEQIIQHWSAEWLNIAKKEDSPFKGNGIPDRNRRAQ